MSSRRRLPPMTALTAFEATARHQSFTRAASELGVTQAAVSRQIHLLEEFVGFPLFVRLHRKVELTEKGKMLSSVSQDAYNMISGCVEDLMQESIAGDFTICATVAFSHFWLLPRISEFSRRHPDVNLRILTQDTIPKLDAGEIDVNIRFGDGAWQDGHAEPMFEDEIFPICSPSYAASIKAIATPHDLLKYPLISNDSDDPTWTGWRDWLTSFGVEPLRKPMGLRCSFYTEAIYAAINGQGIALGWRRLVEDLLDQERLVRLTDVSLRTKSAYFVVLPKRRRLSETTRLFLEWLQDEAQGNVVRPTATRLSI